MSKINKEKKRKIMSIYKELDIVLPITRGTNKRVSQNVVHVVREERLTDGRTKDAAWTSGYGCLMSDMNWDTMEGHKAKIIGKADYGILSILDSSLERKLAEAYTLALELKGVMIHSVNSGGEIIDFRTETIPENIDGKLCANKTGVWIGNQYGYIYLFKDGKKAVSVKTKIENDFADFKYRNEKYVEVVSPGWNYSSLKSNIPENAPNYTGKGLSKGYYKMIGPVHVGENKAYTIELDGKHWVIDELGIKPCTKHEHLQFEVEQHVKNLNAENRKKVPEYAKLLTPSMIMDLKEGDVVLQLDENGVIHSTPFTVGPLGVFGERSTEYELSGMNEWLNYSDDYYLCRNLNYNGVCKPVYGFLLHKQEKEHPTLNTREVFMEDEPDPFDEIEMFDISEACKTVDDGSINVPVVITSRRRRK